VGAKKNPFYRLVAADSRSPRDGRFIEQLGVYDPTREPVEIRLDHERIAHWIGRGAKPSVTVSELIKRSAMTAKAAPAAVAAPAKKPRAKKAAPKKTEAPAT
jgi:small subunit ribosomal protein S16